MLLKTCSKISLGIRLHIVWKVLAIIYGFGFILSLYDLIRATHFYLGLAVYYFILTPLALPFMVIVFWNIALPYFAVTLGLLYWWEKRKQKIKEGS